MSDFYDITKSCINVACRPIDQISDELRDISKQLETYSSSLQYAQKEIDMWRQRFLSYQNLPSATEKSCVIFYSFRHIHWQEILRDGPEKVFEKIKNKEHLARN